MEKAKRILKKVVLFAIAGMLFLSLYTAAGRLYADYFMYATYYQTSKAAKILTPLAPIKDLGSPFDKRTEIINKSLYNYHGSYENFKNDKSSKIIAIVLWPFIAIAIYIIALISWLCWLGIQILQILWQTLIFMCFLIRQVILGEWIESFF